MKYSIEKKDNCCILKVEEEKLLSLNAPKLKSEFVLLNAEGNKSIIVDLSEVKYIDSSGLSALLIGNRMCKEAEGVFILAGLNEYVVKLIRISQLESILNIVGSVEEGEDLLKMDQLESDLS